MSVVAKPVAPNRVVARSVSAVALGLSCFFLGASGSSLQWTRALGERLGTAQQAFRPHLQADEQASEERRESLKEAARREEDERQEAEACR